MNRWQPGCPAADELRPELRRILQGPQPVLYVTHDQQEAMALANRIAVIRSGRIEQIGTPEELYKSPASSFVAGFIGRPQINLLEDGPGVTVGIRPEDLRFDARGMPCRIISRECGIKSIAPSGQPRCDAHALRKRRRMGRTDWGALVQGGGTSFRYKQRAASSA